MLDTFTSVVHTIASACMVRIYSWLAVHLASSNPIAVHLIPRPFNVPISI
jgi:hypothetical protein